MADPLMVGSTSQTEVEPYHELPPSTRTQANEQASETNLSSNSDSVSDSSGIATTFEAHKQQAVDTIMAEAKLILRQNPLVGIRIRAGGRDAARVSKSANTEDNGIRILTWMQGQQKEKEPTMTLSEDALTGLGTKGARAIGEPPFQHTTTHFEPAEMVDTRVTELDDTYPPVELHDTGLSPLETIQKHSHLASKNPGTVTNPVCSSGSSRISQETSGSSKRSREGNDMFRASDDDGRGGDHKKFKRASLPEGFNAPMFACPFYRRNPTKHMKPRSCGGPGWPSIHRLKEHIYRCHKLPIHCPRCGVEFSSQSLLRGHQRLPEGCAVQLVNLPEGIDKEQEMLLRKKQKKGSEEEKWMDAYRILFPDEDGDLIPTPYYDNSQVPEMERQREDALTQYERFQRRELLRVVRNLLEESVSGLAGPLEDQLRGQLVGIIRKAQSEVFLSYRSSDQSREPTGTSLSSSIPETKQSSKSQPAAVVSTVHDLAGSEAPLVLLGEGCIPSELYNFKRDFASLSRVGMGLATNPNAMYGGGEILHTHAKGVDMGDDVRASYEADMSHANLGGGFNSPLFLGDTELESWYANGGF
ncbi:hypothetical protein B0T10DRAFT_555429 [Thelonectria olida]|uniref:C2H2-type domain-containing protein n=1 Tax=Thelonectria olida TaxID=1576542 RepID=A0A9P8WFK9_9HYPO|nr:hypothetical protein B0T10DRAFT_555429 [Thelonectria olida]